MIHKIFALIKSYSPSWVADPIRSLFTALLTPIKFSYGSGHFFSSFKMQAVSKRLEPIPWYTYPCIAFLEGRSFSEDRILEFGGGQSSIWWGLRATKVVTFEGNDPIFSPSFEWAQELRKKLPNNVELHEVSMQSADTCFQQVKEVLDAKPDLKYDVIIIDGLFRKQMVPIALDYLSDEGMIVVDNAEGDELFESFLGSGYSKVEFYGYAPGVYLQSCTAIYFKSQSKYIVDNIAIYRPN